MAQNTSLQLQIKGNDSLQTRMIDSLGYKRSVTNFLQAKQELDSLQKKLFLIGHLDLETMPLRKTSDSTIITTLSLHKKYSQITILYNKDTFPEYIIEKISTNISDNTFSIKLSNTEQALQYLTNHLVNTGNTFSSLSLTNIVKKKERIYATLTTTKSRYRTIDRIHIKGYQKFPKSFLKHQIRLSKGKTFNKKELLIKSNNINNLPFATVTKPPEALFRKDSTEIFLYLKKQTANTFDGFLGFSNDTENGSLELNGYLNLNLINNINYGEQLNLTYKSDQSEQQRFNINLTLPYLFKTPLGIETGLDIFRKDSTFLNTEQYLKLNYLINYSDNISLGYKNSKSNNLLDTPQPSLNINDYNSSFFTIGYKHLKSQNSYLFPIKKNYSISLELGTRKTDNEKTNQIKGEILLKQIFQLNRRNSVLLKNSASAIFSENLFTNELFRFGGINSIRGFEENTLNASLYNILNTEYRYLLSSNLFIHSIIDYGYFEDNTNELSENLTSFGFGLGLNTQTGLFRIIFANGKSNGQNFRFSNTKVHLSLNARF